MRRFDEVKLFASTNSASFSQGSTIAAALLLHHSRENPLDPSFALFKYGIFFSAAAIVDIVIFSADAVAIMMMVKF